MRAPVYLLAEPIAGNNQPIKTHATDGYMMVDLVPFGRWTLRLKSSATPVTSTLDSYSMAEKQTTLRLSHFGIIVVALILIAIAATFSSPLPTEEGEFRKVVTNWVVNGMSVSDAKKELERNGFKVYRGKPRKQWDDQRDYLYASRQKYVFPLFSREWRVICNIGQEESIVGVQAMVFFHAP